MIKISDLSKQFNDQLEVFNQLNLNHEKGDPLAILGENGSGKTTLLKILSSLLPYDRGSITINSEELRYWARTNRSSISWLGANHLGMHPRLTGRENIDYFISYYPQHRYKLITDMDRWCKLNCFKKGLTTPFYLCSTGMKQLLLLFKSLMTYPTLLLLDEPLGNLDTKNRSFVIEELQNFAQSNYLFLTGHQTDNLDDITAKKFNLKELA